MPAVSSQLTDFIMPARAGVRRPSGRGFFARIATALASSRQRQVDREVATFIESRGGRMTDDLERHIARRFM